ncbi:Crp/Fnr family transcriptional regulator [Aureispira sp. CCB-QB1]|uniref:Crp/Fnr family transcriptional regulator n=1 Tax=Aureispira sp. CCB-QB1 TaxID=1313421 RepID=UPI000695C4D2|nr:Crp/Fnr family transcriptional regulator [Aureispira sp. CCB-QB1]
MLVTKINKEIFNRYPLKEEDQIWQKLQKMNVEPKGKIPNNILCFLEEGTIRKYYLNVGIEFDQKLSLDFYLAGDIFVTEKNSFSKQIYYEAIDNGVLWVAEMKEVQKLIVASPQCNTYQRLFLEKQLRDKTAKEIQRLKSTPQDLYLYLLQHRPEFLQLIPLKYLASYIGITPQALSRIRKRIS